MTAAAILLCEDDSELRDELAELLEATGYDVAQAGGLAEAMEMLANRDFAAVITDLALPDGSGLYLLRVCQQQPGAKTAGMRILITGHGGIEHVDQESREDFDALLVKPFDTGNLLVLLPGIDGAT